MDVRGLLGTSKWKYDRASTLMPHHTELARLSLHKHAFHGESNYELRPPLKSFSQKS